MLDKQQCWLQSSVQLTNNQVCHFQVNRSNWVKDVNCAQLNQTQKVQVGSMVDQFERTDFALPDSSTTMSNFFAVIINKNQ